VTTAPKRQPIPFGKYLLLDRINIGGMAEVWRAKTFGAGGFERLVAIKRILPNIAEDAEFISMFIDEAKITVQLNHANIAQIYELSSIGNSYFIAMEYVSGKDMRAMFDRCRKRGEPMPIPLTAYLIAQCCEGLDYAHRANDKNGRPMGIVHRDVSPQNAIISYEGEVKVIDFGVAKAAGKATKTQAGILKGKFGYMSPEQIRGLPLDRRSDVFAIGICLYEMLTGERLFVGDSDFSVLEKVRKVEVLPPSHFNRKIPDVLEKIVMKSLAKDVDERYSYASELAEDLRKFLYTSGYSFGRKDLAAYMRATFAEDVDKEKKRLQEYHDVKPTDAMLASADMGLGMPSPQAPPVPPVVPSSANPMVAPPTIAPSSTNVVPDVRVPPVVRPATSAPRSGNLPRLTAQQPVHAVGKEDHDATVTVDGMNEDSTRPGQASTRALTVRNRPQDSETDPGPGEARGEPADLGPESKTQAIGPAVPAPELAAPVLATPQTEANELPPNALRLPPNAFSPRMAAPMIGANTPALASSSPTVEPIGNMAPRLESASKSELQLIASSNKTVIAILGVGAVVVATLIGLAVAFRPAPKGLLLIEVPAEVSGQVRVSLDGKDLFEADGSPIRDWPQVREVRAGKHTVMMKLPGYETLTETVDVKEGNEPTTLKNVPKKKEAP
jgi:eukaryotic-like serine/threonine-protein kinase